MATLQETVLELIEGNLVTWRNVVIAPVAEEYVFRACLCTVLLAGGYSDTACIFWAPFFFGLAHLHHLLVRPAAQVFMQFAYTTVFGWIAAFLFVRTGHLLAPTLAHCFCNYMGFPLLHLIASSSHPTLVKLSFILGLILFFVLASPLTSPHLYSHNF